MLSPERKGQYSPMWVLRGETLLKFSFAFVFGRSRKASNIATLRACFCPLCRGEIYRQPGLGNGVVR